MRERRPRPSPSKGARRPARGAGSTGARRARPGAGKPLRAGERSARPGAGRPFRAGERSASPGAGKPFRAGERSARPSAGKPFRSSERSARPGAGRPFRAGERTARPGAGKPFRSGERRVRPGAGRPFRSGERDARPGEGQPFPSRRGSSPRQAFEVRQEGGSRSSGPRSARSRFQPRTNSRNTKGEKVLGSKTSVRPVKRERPRDIGKLLDRQPWDLLTPYLLRAGADIVEVLPRIRRFAELLLEWNRGFSNLISTSDENRLVQRHILESLEPANWIKSIGAKRLLDFGSGGGLPALPLALAGIGESWTLVESRRNKTLFLRKVIQEFGLTNIDVELARLESLTEDAGRLGKFDGFTSRATLRLGPTLALAADWVPPGGRAYLWKGSRREQEMVEDRRWEASWERDELFAIGDGQTVVARFVRKTN